jgi:hypothetical protein
MFIRKTATRNKSADESYITYRLVSSERTGKQVRQITLLNLGRRFDLPQADWPRLCTRIDALLAGQDGLLAEPEAIEILAQRYAARLIATRPAAAAPPPAMAAPPSTTSTPSYAEVDVTSLQLTRPRSVGVEAVGLAAMSWLGINPILQDLGFNGVQRAAVAASLIGRMAAPGSELATWQWLRNRSALGELLGVDFEAMPLMRLYRVSDLLVRHREKIETALFGRIEDLFDLPTTVTLYDLTNTYFEGTAAGAFEGEALGLSVGHARPGARRQRLRAPLEDVRRKRRRGQHTGRDAHRSRRPEGGAGDHGRRHRNRGQHRLAQGAGLPLPGG